MFMGVPTMYNYLLKHHATLPQEQQSLARCVFIKRSGVASRTFVMNIRSQCRRSGKSL